MALFLCRYLQRSAPLVTLHRQFSSATAQHVARPTAAPLSANLNLLDDVNPYLKVLPNGLRVIDHSPFVESPINDPNTFNVNAKKQVASAVAEALSDIGCFYVAGKGVFDTDAMIAAREDSRVFFHQSLIEKKRCQSPELGRGYAKLYETHRSIAPNDPVESFVVGPPPELYGKPLSEEDESFVHFLPNIWPRYPPTFKASWEKYWRTTTDTAGLLFRSFSVALGLDEGFLTALCDKGPHITKIKHALDHEPRVLQHTDATIFTILTHMDPTPNALQAQKRRTGEWVFADPIEGGTFINVGDFLEKWSNMRFVSTVHRVEWPRSGPWVTQERLSNAYFAIPNVDALFSMATNCLDPAKKKRLEEDDEWFTYAEYLGEHRQRIKKSGY